MPARADASASSDVSALDASLSSVELAIATLGETLCHPDIVAIEAASTALHEAMRAAMGQFAVIAKRGTMPAALRHRFALANAQIAAQRDALIRATSLVEQNLEILLPRPVAQSSVYSASALRSAGRGDDRSPAELIVERALRGPFAFPAGVRFALNPAPGLVQGFAGAKLGGPRPFAGRAGGHWSLRPRYGLRPAWSSRRHPTSRPRYSARRQVKGTSAMSWVRRSD